MNRPLHLQDEARGPAPSAIAIDRHGERSAERGWFRAWRDLVASAQAVQDAPCEVICPFGFEATGDLRYLARPARRYYVYVAGEATTAPTFADALMRQGGAIVDSLGVIVTNAGVQVLDRTGARPAVLYVLHVEPGAALLDSYAAYIAVSSLLIRDGTLLELQRFGTSPSARRYVYQLSILAEELYDQPHRLASSDRELLRALIRDSQERDVATGLAARVAADDTAKRLLASAVLPLHAAVGAHLDSGADQAAIEVVDFHSGLRHQVTASASKVAGCADVVKRNYLAYPELAGHHVG